MKTNLTSQILGPEVIYSTNFKEGQKRYPVIIERYCDPFTLQTIGEYEISHSSHSYLRAKNRGFSTKDIWLAIDYGEVKQKQGLTYYVVLEKNLPETMDGRTKDRINNLVVIVNGSQILTCYKSKFATRHINKKRQWLS